MYLPSSTYRVQFNKDFNFAAFRRIIPYLDSLGPGALYASPIFKAVPDSSHGYDVTDPLSINPEIGNEEKFNEISKELTSKGIGWIQDIVPNHMAFHPDNNWLTDVLKYGRKSEYASFFDIDWEHPIYKDKLIVPVLDDSPENLVRKGQIKLKAIDEEMHFIYEGFRLPVNPDSLKSLWEKYPDAVSLSSELNNNPDLLMSLLDSQHYILTPWNETDQSINYRRFFTINGLISLRMDEVAVFEKYHQFIFKLIDESKFNGIRLDHIDGLLKPVEYFNRLRAKAGKSIYIVAEKILEFHEKCDPYWPLQGTTGYDFLAMVNGLLTGTGIKKIIDFYCKTTGIEQNPREIIYRNKHDVLKNSFSGDLENICRYLYNKNLITAPSVTKENVKEALGELLVCCPVYRLYSDTLPLYKEDQKVLKGMMRRAERNKPHLKAAFMVINDLLTSNKDNVEAAGVFLRLMQYSGPLMAKGVEDTAMYTWVPYIARNEVGDSITAPTLSAEEFHQSMVERRNIIPAALNATATHDTKRGEDTRARLSVISDIPSTWIRFYSEWSEGVKKHLIRVNNKIVPDENEQYFICQVILGAIPMNGKPEKSFIGRLQDYLRKALREAKINSNWTNPDSDYESAVTNFCKNLLKDHALLNITMSFFEYIRDFGILNSLSQVVLKCMCPGIPDFFQGTELWDFSFVDPDNRRPVDYNLRNKILHTIQTTYRRKDENIMDQFYRSRFEGGIKLWMSHRLMQERFSNPVAFIEGDYVPLRVSGAHPQNILAFMRVHGENHYTVIVPLHLASLKNVRTNKFLNGTRIHLPLHAPDTWESLWDNSIIRSEDHTISGSELEFNFPLVLKGKLSKTSRGSGILLHVTSLPGRYGTGSLGQEAFDFIEWLKRGGQKYWQILPFNPPGLYNSPYSSPSAFAGNTSMIDPRTLLQQHLIRKLPAERAGTNKASYKKALQLRKILFNEAYETFKSKNNILLKQNFEEFCYLNSNWLDDFAVFSSLQIHYGMEWYDWPANIKNHELKHLNNHKASWDKEIDRIKFIQYLFHDQFTRLKVFASSSRIKIIGDLPMYVAYNSADVWAHHDLFKLDHKGSMKSVAGVPPDLFSNTGQLWNMPVYDWSKMKEDDFLWWKERIRRNLQYCDILRLDHFRALSAFWEIPAGESTARNGIWTPAPGIELLKSLKREFPVLPFIAEDLGEIDDGVLKLRDQFLLPGMKVLMFAFDNHMPRSFHIPHNFQQNSVVYTGTHDNNTVIGWFKKIDNYTKGQMKNYLGKRPHKSSVTWNLIRLALTSVSDLAVIPLQDILMLDESARLNTPSGLKGNWKWELKDFNDMADAMERLYKLSYYTGRI